MYLCGDFRKTALFYMHTSAIRLKVVHFPPVMVTSLESLTSITWLRDRAFSDKVSHIPRVGGHRGMKKKETGDPQVTCLRIVRVVNLPAKHHPESAWLDENKRNGRGNWRGGHRCPRRLGSVLEGGGAQGTCCVMKIANFANFAVSKNHRAIDSNKIKTTKNATKHPPHQADRCMQRVDNDEDEGGAETREHPKRVVCTSRVD